MTAIDQTIRKARLLSGKGERAEAERLYREVLGKFPGNKRVLAELQALGAPEATNPPQPEINAIVALYRQGRLAEALAHAEELLGRYPNGEVLCNIAGALNAGLGRLDRAIACYDRAVALAPDYFEALNNRGNALKDSKRLPEALASYDAALRFNPGYADAHINRGITLALLKRLDDALASYDLAVANNPDRAEAHNNRGNALKDLNRLQEALASYEAAIRLRPNYANAYVNRGNVLKKLRRLEDAVASYDKAIALAPKLVEAFTNRGSVLRDLKRLDEALASQEQALRLKPGHIPALAEALNLRAHMCLWSGNEHGSTLAALAATGEAISPFYLLNADDPQAQLQCAATWSRDRYPSEQPFAFPAPMRQSKIRIGYFSADFHNHATMYLMARLFELHDRERFEIHAFSYGPSAQDAMRQRLVDAVDGFHEVGHLSDQAIAACARDQAIDIAIDLKGHTEDTRMGLFAYRAAPIQLGYLGYPGTTGADFIDIIVADAVTIPETHRNFYSEKVAYLPGCYQVNDDRRAISDTAFRRADLGLPEQGFVFCSFNNNYKISPAEFDIWMRILDRVEGSVLWLLQGNRWAVANLRAEAKARGIDPDRLVFADRMPLADHLARHRCADLFLDSFAINAHTTASDALWAGLPVLTKSGDSFAARVAGSLLHAIDLPELVTDSTEAYERLALDLATNPTQLAAIKQKLAANRLTTPLFDTHGTTRALEELYARLYVARLAEPA